MVLRGVATTAAAQTHDFGRNAVCLATLQIYRIESAFQQQDFPDDLICTAKFKKTLSTGSSFSAKSKQWGRKYKCEKKSKLD